MAKYRMLGSDALAEHDVETLMATHPAPVGTFIVYAFADGTHSRTPVVLWGVLRDGSAVPITFGGVWDGTSNKNRFVLHPDGSCSDCDRCWDGFDEASAEMRGFDE